MSKSRGATMEANQNTLFSLIRKPCKILLFSSQTKTAHVEIGTILSIDEKAQRIQIQHQEEILTINLSDIIALRPIERS